MPQPQTQPAQTPQPIKRQDPADFAASYKKAYPQFAGVDDLTLVNRVLKDHPDTLGKLDLTKGSRIVWTNNVPQITYWGSPQGQASPASGLAQSMAEAQGQKGEELKEFAKSRDTDRYLRDAMRDIAPMALFSPLSRLGFIRGTMGAAGAGAAGGQIGEMVDSMTGSDQEPGTFTDWLSRRGEDAAFGAATELGGRAVGGLVRGAAKPLKGVLGGALGDAPKTLRENIAREYNIHFTPSQVMDEFSATTGKPKGLLMRGEESRAFHNPYSRSIAQSGARVRGRAAKSTVLGLVDQLGPNIPANISGQRIANVIESVGKPTWSRQVEHLKSTVNALSLGTKVDVTSLKKEAEEEIVTILKQQRDLGNVDQEGHPILPNTAKVKMLSEIAEFPDDMPFSTLSAKRTQWMNVSPQITELVSGEAKGTAKHYTQLSTSLLDEAARTGGKHVAPTSTVEFLRSATLPEGSLHGVLGVPEMYSADDLVAKGLVTKVGEGKFKLTPTGVDSALWNEAKTKWMAANPGKPPNFSEITLEAQKLKSPPPPPPKRGFKLEWDRFRNFTRKGADVFESQIITDAVNKNPEEVVRAVKGDDITNILRLRRAIKGYAEHFGTISDQIKAASAWKKFQVSYMRENIIAPLDGNMLNLEDSLNNMDPAVKKAIFDDPQSQQTLLRLTQVGKALKDADKNLGVLMGHQDPLADVTSSKGWFRSIRPYVVAKIAWNPTATRFFLRGLTMLADSAPSDSAIKDVVTKTLLGKGSKIALKAGGFITNRRLGAAMADIMRAYDLANISDEAKEQDARAKEFLDKAAGNPMSGYGWKEGSTGVQPNQPQ